MIGTVQSHDVLSPAATRFFEAAERSFGMDGTAEIWNTAHMSFVDAQRDLPLVSPAIMHVEVTSMTGGFAVESVCGRAKPWESSLTIYIDPRVSVEQATLLLPETIRHETAHVAHAQLNKAAFPGRSEATLFSAIVHEGVARHVQYGLRSDYFAGAVYNYDAETVSKINDALVDVLYDPAVNEDERYYSFLFGDKSFWRKGYVVGHWIVAQMAQRESLDYKDLMQVSLDEWRQFVEHTV